MPPSAFGATQTIEGLSGKTATPLPFLPPAHPTRLVREGGGENRHRLQPSCRLCLMVFMTLKLPDCSEVWRQSSTYLLSVEWPPPLSHRRLCSRASFVQIAVQIDIHQHSSASAACASRLPASLRTSRPSISILLGSLGHSLQNSQLIVNKSCQIDY